MKHTTTPYLLFCLLLSSCSTYYYMPNMHQVPLLRAKGEVRIAGGAGVQSMVWNEATTGELQLAYALSDHVGLMCNSAKYRSAVHDNKDVGRLLECGVGYYAKLGPHFVAEGYAGVGRGEVVHAPDRLSLWRAFIQPSIGRASRNFDIALTARLCYLDYDSPQFHRLSIQESGEVELRTALAPARFLLEPGIVMRAGGRSLKFQLQYVYTTNLSKEINMLHTNVSIALQLNINNTFRRGKK